MPNTDTPIDTILGVNIPAITKQSKDRAKGESSQSNFFVMNYPAGTISVDVVRFLPDMDRKERVDAMGSLGRCKSGTLVDSNGKALVDSTGKVFKAAIKISEQGGDPSAENLAMWLAYGKDIGFPLLAPGWRTSHSEGPVSKKILHINGDDKFYFVMPLLPGRMIHDLLNSLRPMSYWRRLRMARAVLRAMKDYHQNTGMVHGDISLGNVLYDEERDIAYIIDPMLACENGSASDQTINGTPGFIAPECGTAKTRAFQADYYSTGALLGHIMGGFDTFVANRGDDNREFFASTMFKNGNVSFPMGGRKELMSVVRQLIDEDPNSRNLDSALDEISKICGRFESYLINVTDQANALQANALDDAPLKQFTLNAIEAIRCADVGLNLTTYFKQLDKKHVGKLAKVLDRAAAKKDKPDSTISKVKKLLKDEHIEHLAELELARLRQQVQGLTDDGDANLKQAAGNVVQAFEEVDGSELGLSGRKKLAKIHAVMKIISDRQGKNIAGENSEKLTKTLIGLFPSKKLYTHLENLNNNVDKLKKWANDKLAADGKQWKHVYEFLDPCEWLISGLGLLEQDALLSHVYKVTQDDAPDITLIGDLLRSYRLVKGLSTIRFSKKKKHPTHKLLNAMGHLLFDEAVRSLEASVHRIKNFKDDTNQVVGDLWLSTTVQALLDAVKTHREEIFKPGGKQLYYNVYYMTNLALTLRHCVEVQNLKNPDEASRFKEIYEGMLERQQGANSKTGGFVFPKEIIEAMPDVCNAMAPYSLPELADRYKHRFLKESEANATVNDDEIERKLNAADVFKTEIQDARGDAVTGKDKIEAALNKFIPVVRKGRHSPALNYFLKGVALLTIIPGVILAIRQYKKTMGQTCNFFRTVGSGYSDALQKQYREVSASKYRFKAATVA